MRNARNNEVTTATAWRAAGQAEKEARAERLRLPSGTVILAARPDPLDWIISGRLPQKLLSVVLEGNTPAETNRELSREEILELAAFATHLVKASVVRPRLGEGPGEIPLDDVSVKDRAFIFAWACRSLNPAPSAGVPESKAAQPLASANPTQEDLSSAALESFRSQ